MTTLSRFIFEGSRVAAQLGLRLRWRNDFDELVRLNKQHASEWFRLVDAYNPEYSDLSPANSFWISAENDAGEIISTWAARVFHWPDASLAERAGIMFYGRETDRPCVVTAEAAKLITGTVLCGGAAWVRPDWRGLKLSHLIPRIGKAHALLRWPVDWSVCYVSRALVDSGVATGYGQKNFSYSILYPGSPWGDLEVVLAYTSAEDSRTDLIECARSTL